MTLRPGSQEQYEKRHNPIGSDLRSVLKDHGVHNYSIFLDPASDRLFAYVEIESEKLWQQIAETEVCRRWWSSMKDLMLTSSDDSPQSTSLKEVFHID